MRENQTITMENISMMKNPNLDTLLLILKEWLAKNYKESLTKIVLYGSQARGDAREYSDIDILIVLNRTFDYGKEIERTGEFIADLSLKYETVISSAFITEERFNFEQSPFLLNVRREGIIL